MKIKLPLIVGGVFLFFWLVWAMAILGADRQRPQPRQPGLGQPLNGLTPQEAAAFRIGEEEFNEDETPETGLGPLFNGTSCGGCHPNGGMVAAIETNFGRVLNNGTFDPLASLGGPLIQQEGVGRQLRNCSSTGEKVPAQANVTSLRLTIPLFGLGLLEGVPVQSIRSKADPLDSNRDGISGVAAMVVNPDSGVPMLGRFGWKCQIPTVHAFAGLAYLNEIGITSPPFPNENGPFDPDCDKVQGLEDDGGDVTAFEAFMGLLAPPAPASATPKSRRGATIFNSIGCDKCHLPTLRTGSHSVQALSGKTIHPYTDLLLHDIGTGDGVPGPSATGSEFRTAPLWGLRHRSPFMHDGASRSILSAINRHAGEATAARLKAAALSPADQSALLEFLSRL